MMKTVFVLKKSTFEIPHQRNTHMMSNSNTECGFIEFRFHNAEGNSDRLIAVVRVDQKEFSYCYMVDQAGDGVG